MLRLRITLTAISSVSALAVASFLWVIHLAVAAPLSFWLSVFVATAVVALVFLASFILLLSSWWGLKEHGGSIWYSPSSLWGLLDQRSGSLRTLSPCRAVYTLSLYIAIAMVTIVMAALIALSIWNFVFPGWWRFLVSILGAVGFYGTIASAVFASFAFGNKSRVVKLRVFFFFVGTAVLSAFLFVLGYAVDDFLSVRNAVIAWFVLYAGTFLAHQTAVPLLQHGTPLWATRLDAFFVRLRLYRRLRLATCPSLIPMKSESLS